MSSHDKYLSPDSCGDSRDGIADANRTTLVLGQLQSFTGGSPMDKALAALWQAVVVQLIALVNIVHRAVLTQVATVYFVDGSGRCLRQLTRIVRILLDHARQYATLIVGPSLSRPPHNLEGPT